MSELALREAAQILANAEKDLAAEFLRLVAAGTNSYQAQKMAEVALGGYVHTARAGYEIALARLKSGAP